MSELEWRFYVWMCNSSKLKGLAWRFFFWITPRSLSKKFQIYMLRCYVERYPGEMERKIREALPESSEHAYLRVRARLVAKSEIVPVRWEVTALTGT